MLDDPVGNLEAIDLLQDDLARVRAQEEMDLMGARIDAIQKPLQIDCATGAGTGDDEFQSDYWAAVFRYSATADFHLPQSSP